MTTYETTLTRNVNAYSTFVNLKKRYPEAIIILRMPDTYRIFETDADKVSNIIPEKKHSPCDGTARYIEFGHGALDSVLPRIIRAGYRVAICDFQ